MYECLYELGERRHEMVKALLLPKGLTMAPTTTPVAARSAFDLDIRIVSGPDRAAALLLGSTDDGCDTLANGDC